MKMILNKRKRCVENAPYLHHANASALNSGWLLISMAALSVLLTGGCTEPSGPTPAAPIGLTRREAIPATLVKMTTDLDPFPPVLHSNEWQEPIPVDGPINTAGAEDSPFITPDGNTLYFFFTPDVSVPPEKQLLDGVTGIYVSTKQNGIWGQEARVLLQDPAKLALDGCPFIKDAILWFCSAREG